MSPHAPPLPSGDSFVDGGSEETEYFLLQEEKNYRFGQPPPSPQAWINNAFSVKKVQRCMKTGLQYSALENVLRVFRKQWNPSNAEVLSVEDGCTDSLQSREHCHSLSRR